MDELRAIWAANLKAARLRWGLFQSDIAAACQVSQQAVAKWERTGAIPVDKQIIIAHLLDVDVRDLFPAEVQ